MENSVKNLKLTKTNSGCLLIDSPARTPTIEKPFTRAKLTATLGILPDANPTTNSLP